MLKNLLHTTSIRIIQKPGIEFQKIINLLHNTPNQASKFRTRNWVEKNDDVLRTKNTNCRIKFKTAFLKSSLCYYSDVYILVKGIVTVASTLVATGVTNNANKKVIFKTGPIY